MLIYDKCAGTYTEAVTIRPFATMRDATTPVVVSVHPEETPNERVIMSFPSWYARIKAEITMLLFLHKQPPSNDMRNSFNVRVWSHSGASKHSIGGKRSLVCDTSDIVGVSRLRSNDAGNVSAVTIASVRGTPKLAFIN